MEAYFDNSATTRVLDSVMDIVTRTMTVDYANPAAKHIRGMEAENYIRDARSIIAKTLKVADKEILFTSGGSESNNMALIGTAMANKRAGMHIISTNVEHASIYNTLGFLQPAPQTPLRCSHTSQTPGSYPGVPPPAAGPDRYDRCDPPADR